MTIDVLHPVVEAGKGERVRLGGIGVNYKVPAEATGGGFAIVEHPVEPGVLVPPHVHTREDEFSFVIEGEVGVRIGDHVFTARTGDYVVKPRDVPHTFWNSGPAHARLLEILSPPQFGQYFREMAAILAEGGEPDFERIASLAGRYGVTFLMDWVPELSSTYGVTVLGR
ncbi:cupin domain-containing protein [Streptomyces sp. LN549]|uniref:cupin domain-containing protein n=1 Tax=Streptomyces sp. LN549 TaxID=3112979 RepID=UPI003716F221